jgi:antitoxin (DNA-binding transcriptional repressor) of toxin-antitoxin stability system
MIVTATELANDSKSILDKVVFQGEEVEIQRHGKTVAVIRPKEGVSKEEALRRLNALDWTSAERATLKKAIDEAGEVFGYAGRD